MRCSYCNKNFKSLDYASHNGWGVGPVCFECHLLLDKKHHEELEAKSKGEKIKIDLKALKRRVWLQKYIEKVGEPKSDLALVVLAGKAGHKCNSGQIKSDLVTIGYKREHHTKKWIKR